MATWGLTALFLYIGARFVCLFFPYVAFIIALRRDRLPCPACRASLRGIHEKTCRCGEALSLLYLVHAIRGDFDAAVAAGLGFPRTPDNPAEEATGPHCKHCGYSLKGLPSKRCPECGKWADSDKRLREWYELSTWERLRPRAPLHISACLGLFPLGVFMVTATRGESLTVDVRWKLVATYLLPTLAFVFLVARGLLMSVADVCIALLGASLICLLAVMSGQLDPEPLLFLLTPYPPAAYLLWLLGPWRKRATRFGNLRHV